MHLNTLNEITLESTSRVFFTSSIMWIQACKRTNDTKFRGEFKDFLPQFKVCLNFTSTHVSSCCFTVCLSPLHNPTTTCPHIFFECCSSRFEEKRKNNDILANWEVRESNTHKSFKSLFKCTKWVKLSLIPPWENPRV